jgi:hypothetical protein
MPYVTGWARVRVWVPSGYDWAGRPVDPEYGVEGPVDPGFGVDEGAGIGGGPVIPGRPGQGLPWPGLPGRPGQGLPWPGRPADPGWGIEEGAPGQLPVFPGWGRPGQPLPRPPRPGPFPIVDPDQIGDIAGPPAPLPDRNMPGGWATVSAHPEPYAFPAWIVDPRGGPEVDEDYVPRPPKHGLPGSWVTVLTDLGIAWAWIPDAPPSEETEPETPEREPR